MITPSLLKKYNQAVPRYTSYPTVPKWQDSIDSQAWINTFSSAFSKHNSEEGISLYIHLPFCESLCTYCGCNKKITTNHNVEDPYIEAVLKEWELYRQHMTEKPVIRELHLGGGTPTFFSTENLEKLLGTIFDTAVIHPDHQFSFEGHPNNTTYAHLLSLYNLGFRRVSFGVQDNDPTVQFIINRIQPFENVKNVTEWAREIGYTSVNFDLIYGLPKQTPESIERTLLQCISLQPDRVAFYSYAHVPWTSRGQRLFDEKDLPSADLKMQLYRLGKFLFSINGYCDIGMDHFALKNDELFIAREEGRLHRNFMGYTTQATRILIGLGVSSISDTGNGYAQNAKALHDYYAHIHAGELAVQKGCLLTEEDLRFKQYILDISCKGGTVFDPQDRRMLETYSMPVLHNLEADGFIELHPDSVKVTALGHHFIRNICSAFDLYLQRDLVAAELNSRPTYSKAI